MRRPLTPRLSLRAYLILLVVVCGLPMVLFSLWLTATIARDRRAAVRDGMLDTARALAIAVDRDLQADTRTLQAMAASYSLDAANLSAVRQEMRRVAASQHEWRAISLHTPDGRRVLDTGAPLLDGREPDPVGVRRVLDTGAPLVSAAVDASDAFAVRVPVVRNGVVHYVLSATVTASVVREIFRRQSLPLGWIGSLVDGDGVIIARSRDPSGGAERTSPFPLSLTGAGEGWGGRVQLSEGSFYFAHARPQLSDWHIVLAAPVAALDDPWMRAVRAILIGGVALLAVASVLTILAVRPITRSLRGLAGAAADLGRGHTPARIGSAVSELELVGRDLEAAGRAREAAERAVREREAQLSAVINQATAGIAETDLEGRFVLVNRRYCDLAGRSADELIGLSLMEIVHPADRARAVATLQGLTGDEPEVITETRYLHPDGSICWVDASLSLVRDTGSPPSVAIVALDATGRRAAEDATRALDARFRLLAAAAPVLVWMAGPDTSRTWFSPQWIVFVGRTLEQELGTGWLENVHADDRARCAETGRREFAARRRFSLEYRLRRHDGLYRWVREDGVPLFTPDGAFTGYIGACADVTSQKMAELERGELLAREQKARREVEAASQAKDEFLAVLSHELRTPLNALRLWVSILRAGPPDAQTFRRAVDTIDRNAELQARLIEDLLDVSRIVSGQLRLATERVDLVAVVGAALETLRAAADNKDIGLSTRLDPELGAVLGDPTRLQQVVWNLLANAVRFTPPGGRVEVSLRQVGHEAELTVADSGRGIAPDLLPHVFDRFRQGESGTTRSHGGLGLGLSIARQLVELHGGTIRARSPGEGRGATFTVRLPIAASVAGRPPRPPVASLRDDSGRDPARLLEDVHVLVVDDDVETCEVMAVALGREGARVTTAPSVAGAVEAIERGWPDVLVSDIGMPGEDGYDLIRKVRRLEASRGRHIPAIALTAYAAAEDRRRALEAGFEAHVAKPVPATAVAPLIVSLLPLRR